MDGTKSEISAFNQVQRLMVHVWDNIRNPILKRSGKCLLLVSKLCDNPLVVYLKYLCDSWMRDLSCRLAGSKFQRHTGFR